MFSRAHSLEVPVRINPHTMTRNGTIRVGLALREVSVTVPDILITWFSLKIQGSITNSTGKVCWSERQTVGRNQLLLKGKKKQRRIVVIWDVELQLTSTLFYFIVPRCVVFQDRIFKGFHLPSKRLPSRL